MREKKVMSCHVADLVEEKHIALLYMKMNSKCLVTLFTLWEGTHLHILLNDGVDQVDANADGQFAIATNAHNSHHSG